MRAAERKQAMSLPAGNLESSGGDRDRHHTYQERTGWVQSKRGSYTHIGGGELTLELDLKDRLHYSRQRGRSGKCRRTCEGWLTGYVKRYGERDEQVPAHELQGQMMVGFGAQWASSD